MDRNDCHRAWGNFKTLIYSLHHLKQELNSSETSCDRVGGLIGGVVKKASFSMVERGLVKKVSISSLEISVVQKSISALLDWAKKKKKTSPKSCQKVVKKLSKSSKSCQKVVNYFVKPGKNEQIRENKFF
jgi:hypothetical protein